MIHACRKELCTLCEKFREKPARLAILKVIQKVLEPTKWENSVVAVVKFIGALRVYLDFRSLNKAIKKEPFKLPTMEKMIHLQCLVFLFFQ